MANITPPLHLRLRGGCDEGTARRALRAVLDATHLLGLTTGTHLRKLRELSDPLADLQARLQEAELRARLAWETAELLGARFAKIPEKHRPYFSPAQRFRVLEIRNLLAWNAHETARVFLLCSNTILNWEMAADPSARAVGVTIQPTPPVRRAADVVRSLVQTMTRLGIGGQDLCSRILARAGWSVSARSIGRYRRERPVPPTHGNDIPTRPPNPVKARFVHHVWMMDVSEVRQLLGPSLYMAAVFDTFSRVSLALEVFEAKPTARDMARLLKRAISALGPARYLITDLGGEFTGHAFRKAARRFGALHRFASEDSLKATARLERFWKTLKQAAALGSLWRPLDRQELERRLEVTLCFYLYFRPHEGLKGATPAEAFLALVPAHLAAVEPPRARPGEASPEAPFQVDYLDPGARRFPILRPAA